ncbi:SUMF1/EgtB/PvdO family nonheme iron enzyme [Flagellimonas olearia]|uniref:SUMF1/EgtB/PvdO family nonheme iron enzyme n=1 Tax=Flagellimonas olearia TaxID=552546 RepID=A0A6I1DW93_9FLAO|nr:formylglycine-generating enzyme family protein [Allomuricauda olearia]KAB7529408.1 SUMF1/EgtB/PvdO family nonheme iron enzyme [Allomuricauda olearia]
MSIKKYLIPALLCLGITLGQAQDKDAYVQELTGTDLSIDMVAIPEGTFMLGSPEGEHGRNADEGPQRNMDIPGFWMSQYEITWELYNLFLQRSIDQIMEEHKGSDVNLDVDAVTGATIPYVDMSLGMGTESGLPIGNVTQLAASKFCEWLSAKTGHFYRLPTEAEWEYAARAGSQDPYFFEGDNLDEYAWYSQNSDDTYHPVGEKKPNPWGLYDIYGNVAEWTLDQYFPDAYQDKNAYFQPIQKEYPVVVRGGSFKDDATELRSASRKVSKPLWKQRDPQFPRSKWWHTDAPFVGFRIVRPMNPPPPEDYHLYWIHKN